VTGQDELESPDDAATFQRLEFRPAKQRTGAFELEVVEGVDRGKTFVVDGSKRLLLGTSPACDVRLADPQISRRHLALEPAAARLRLVDLNSTNGTVIEGLSIVEAHLNGGEVIRIGATALRLNPSAAAAPALSEAEGFGNLLGKSPEMRRLYPMCTRLAASSVPVIIEGETGTGKEVLAESLHELGPRAEGPFVVFDCTAVSPSLVESELFGHERGAFTGALSTRKGVFEQASGGTLLIDEIGDLDLSLQPKLLRALEKSEVRRVGGSAFIKVNVRVLAATRRDLDQEVHAGRFRDDLFHRLAVARIELPALRRRKGDIALLADRFRADMGAEHAFPPHLIRRWEDYHWPGNVRELRNVVARTLALGECALGRAEAEVEKSEAGDDNALSAGALVERILSMKLPLTEARQRLVEAFEQLYIDRVLEDHHGNVTRAAVAARVGRRYFQRLRAKRP
jgi:DNA-binding NtrC family response regulator